MITIISINPVVDSALPQKSQVLIVSLMDDSSTGRLAVYPCIDEGASMHLSRRACQQIEGYLDNKALLCWYSTQDMHTFLGLTKKYIKTKIRRQSVILPAPVAEIIRADETINIASFGAAHNEVGLTIAGLYKRRGCYS